MGEVYSDFAYDDAFRTMIVKCDELVIPLINCMFNEHFGSGAKVVRNVNERFMDQESGAQEKRITDSLLEISEKDVTKKYHVECESDSGGTVLIRLFEYDAQIALDEGEYGNYRLNVRFPNTGVLFLRSSRSTPDEMWINIETPGGKCSYPVKVLKRADYSLDEIFEKQLYFLLPFYIFNYEKRLKIISEDEKKTDDLMQTFEKILQKLGELSEKGELSSFNKGVIIRLMYKVAYKQTDKYKNLQEKVGGIMGGKVLDLDIIVARDKALEEGMRQGVKQGMKQGVKQGEAQGIESSIEKLACHYMKENEKLSRDEAVKMAEAILR